MRQQLHGLGAGARVRAWPHLSTTALLVLTPTAEATPLDQWCDRLAASGYTSVRTNALGPTLARDAARVGFVAAQDLALLVHNLDEPPRRTGTATRRLPVAQRDTAVRVDVAAFPYGWALDLVGVREVCDATPWNRARATRVGGQVVGYAVSGRDSRTAFLQRIAVDPDWRRHGHAAALVGDALRWARRNRAEAMYVNTPTDNAGALLLYEQCGFHRLSEGLQVMERSLT